jgi:molybdopterin molybdotransferase
MQEDTHREGEFLYVDTTLQKGENIRGRGTELASGTEVLRGGTYVNPPVISLLATLGRSSANVYRRPAVGIVSTGSELALPGTPLLTGQIYESITAGLRSAIIRAGATVDSCRLVADDPDDTESAMREALRSDVTITCGGVSVGDHDLVKATFTRLGVTERFWRVAIRPGKPFFFGVGPNGNPVFGLPGNPVSALVTFFLFVRPALRAMVGLAAEPSALIGLGQDWPEIGDRDDFVRAAVLDGRAWPTRAQGSHMLTGLAQADVLIRLPAGSGPYRAGQPVEAWHLDW